MRKLKFIAECDSIDQVLALLDLTRELGINPAMGAGDFVEVKRKKPTLKQRFKKGERRKPKRYPPNLQIKCNARPGEGPPALLEAYDAIEAEFGGQTFRKGDAKSAISKRMNGSSHSTYVTRLMDLGSLTAV